MGLLVQIDQDAARARRLGRGGDPGGELDFRGTLGVSKETPVGFRAIRLAFEVDSPAPQGLLDQLVTLTERYRVVLQTLDKRRDLAVEIRRPGLA